MTGSPTYYIVSRSRSKQCADSRLAVRGRREISALSPRIHLRRDQQYSVDPVRRRLCPLTRGCLQSSQYEHRQAERCFLYPRDSTSCDSVASHHHPPSRYESALVEWTCLCMEGRRCSQETSLRVAEMSVSRMHRFSTFATLLAFLLGL